MTRILKLGKQPHKLNRDLTLLQNEKCTITAQEGTLTLQILMEGNTRGYLLAGRAQFTLDAIIDTPRGATGKSIHTDLNQPFLVFSPADAISQNSTPATAQDISNTGFDSLEDFLVRANDVFSQFTINSHKNPELEENTQMFAIPASDKTWNILIAKENKLIFTSKNKIYIFRDVSENSEFHPQITRFAEDGKMLIIDRNNILIEFNSHHRFI